MLLIGCFKIYYILNIFANDDINNYIIIVYEMAFMVEHKML